MRGEALLSEQALLFGVFQVCEGKCLASKGGRGGGAPDTRDGKGACLVSGAPRSLFTTPKKPENITPVMEAMRGETRRQGRNNLFPLRVTFLAGYPRISVPGRRSALLEENDWLLDRRLILWNYVWYLNGGFSTFQTSKPSLVKILAG